MISVIVPVYNAEKYLDRCIQSVLDQTYSDLELILVNDGSKDSSLGICQRFEASDSRIRVVDKTNGGVSSARNAGIERARGRYITFLDSDDYYSPDFLSVFDTERIYADFYSQGCISEYPDRKAEIRAHSLTDTPDISAFMATMLESSLICSPWAKLYLREIIDQHDLRFDENISYAEDRLFNVAYLNHCKSFYVTENAGYHYTHDNPGALTRRIHSSAKLMAYIRQYRPLLRQLTNECQLSRETLRKATWSYNYDLILAVINKFRETRSYIKRMAFLHSIPKEFVKDAASQKNFPKLFRNIASAMLFPAIIAVPAISFYIRIKEMGFK